MNSHVSWKDGMPTVVYKEMLTKDVVAELPIAAMSMPYERTEEEIFLNKDPDFEGKSNAEVMNIRLARRAAAGDTEAIKMINDRVLGKPKQQIESTKLTMTYADYLEQITQEENANTQMREVDIEDIT